MNPNDPESQDRDWIGQIWNNIVRKALRLPVEKLPFEDAPAISQVSISSPNLLATFWQGVPYGSKYPDIPKPFNFLLTAHLEPFGVPVGTDSRRFQLIAPYEHDPRKWLKMDWVDKYSGKLHRIAVEDDENAHMHGGPVLVKTYDSVIEEYENHPEPKCVGDDGSPCNQRTIGLLQRRHVRIGKLVFIGKESNRLEEALGGLIHDERDVIAEYPDPKRGEWLTETVPVLNKIPTSELEKETGLSRSAIKDIKTGRSVPHRKSREKLVSFVQRWKQSNHGKPAKSQAKRKPNAKSAKSACTSNALSRGAEDGRQNVSSAGSSLKNASPRQMY